ncbi:hypothetical protein [Flavobacterium sp. J27]|uniref:hypothetical protein n=1 Tax=Flavobacterium sp. J27 TaxID=2060419 RepID=UPI001031A0FC|nr:hypothetical protein [Flavobacterium sp. J27]
MKNFFDLIKDNFNLLVSVPPLLGAIWQLIELSRISLSYIRFFSISQLIADGALFLIVILLLLASTIWFNLITKKNNEDEENKKLSEFLEVKKPNLIHSFLFSLIGLGVIICGLIFANNYFIKNINSIVVIWFILPVNIIIVAIGYTSYLKGMKHVENIFSINRKSRLKIYTYMIITVLFIHYLKIYYNEFNKQMLLPKNLVNIKDIEKDIKTNYPNTTISLKYLNDKYIFYSIIDKKGNEKIKIIKFDNLFE